jgi:hypothetical protein
MTTIFSWALVITLGVVLVSTIFRDPFDRHWLDPVWECHIFWVVFHALTTGLFMHILFQVVYNGRAVMALWSAAMVQLMFGSAVRITKRIRREPDAPYRRIRERRQFLLNETPEAM